ncbi:hypothetical protein L596_020900 [Steinernema carpocapsae]|uniref:G-protein coupled receptors family 1 profile domain-containing protein n=1 Tax=Steinernema carpocapsae TaxID=34508 RepID=A0A4V6A115_STECR|nr:hypothetical protein L596_020900 [Steinernema carpocapsae]
MLIARQLVSAFELILEPYFLPAMRVYRLYLVVISVCNLMSTIVIGLVWSFTVSLEQRDQGFIVCFLSSRLIIRWSSVVAPLQQLCNLAQFQVQLVMLFYATSVIKFPHLHRVFGSLKSIPVITVFVLIPSFFVLPLLESIRIPYTMCYKLSLDNNFSTFLFAFSLYTLIYGFLVALFLWKLSDIMRSSNAVSEITVQLVRTIVINFSVSLGALFILALCPPMVLLVLTMMIETENEEEKWSELVLF